MSVPSRHLCRALLRSLNYRSSPQPCRPLRQRSLRPFTSSVRQLAESNDEPSFDVSLLETPVNPMTPADLTPSDRANYDTLTKVQQAEYMAIQNHIRAVGNDSQLDAASEAEIEDLAASIDREHMLDFTEVKNPLALRDGYWQEDEDDDLGINPDGDDDVNENDITSIAESELELHREIREYTRIAAWELPMFLQYTKAFEIPDMKVSPLRFRYTTYMGETHPAQKKVVLEFVTKELAETAGLNEVQRSKFIKIIGSRYNPDKDLVKMSCEKFENQAQNKRYLGDLVNKIIAESKTGDMFEDVPYDFRHHTSKPQYVFPESWVVGNEDGVKRLTEEREKLMLGQGEEKVVDGKILMEEFVRVRQGTGSYLSRR